MATNSLLMVYDQTNTTNINVSDTQIPETLKQNGRKKSKSNESTHKKKQPQRGMGVAQLERLRLQERWKKMTEFTPHIPSLNFQNYVFIPSTLSSHTSSPMNGVPVQYCSRVGGSGMANVVGQSSNLSQNNNMLLQRVGNGRVGGSFGGGLGSDQFQVDPYGVGAPNSSFRVGNVVETSKELSSIPNMKCQSEHCCVCHKKKRMNGEILGSNGVVPLITGCGFAGFNGENNQNNEEGQDLIMKAMGQSGYASQSTGQEVVAVHRKGSGGGKGLFMEYEFFPDKSGKSSTCFKEWIKLGSSESSSVNATESTGEASCVTVRRSSTGVGVDASTSIDLSLKLSY